MSEAAPRSCGDEALHRQAGRLGLAQRLGLAREISGLLAALSRAAADDAVLSAAQEAVANARELLNQAPSSDHQGRILDGSFLGFGAFAEIGPFLGALQPTSPPLQLTFEQGRVEAVATYGPAHEGGPGMVHGGFIAGAFDEMLGMAQRGTIRVTGQLTIRYRAPAMLGRALHYAAWLDRVEGRKAHVIGQLHDGDVLCAEAEAVFIAPGSPLPFSTGMLAG